MLNDFSRKLYAVTYSVVSTKYHSMHVVAMTAVIIVLMSSSFIFKSLKKTFPVHKTGSILITGAGKGIGYATALHLAQTTGFYVFAGVRSETDSKAIRALGFDNLLPISLDVTSAASRKEAISIIERATISSRVPPLVALVNNAGQARLLPLEFHTEEDAKYLMDVNFHGPAELTKQCLPLLRASQGRVIFVSSFAGIFASPFGGMYSASKFAVEAYGDTLRREMTPYSVSVSLVEPGFVKTGVVNASIPASERASAIPIDGPEMKGLYSRFCDGVGASLKQDVKAGSDPIVVAQAIRHAIVSNRPCTRYLVATTALGIEARYLAWLAWFLPTRWQDKIVGC